jgi:hypothetical protein
MASHRQCYTATRPNALDHLTAGIASSALARLKALGGEGVN